MTWKRNVQPDHAITAIIVAIVICARLVSFGYLSSLSQGNPSSYPYPIVSGDSIHYATLADNFLTFHAYQWTEGVPNRGAPPGYSALLAATKAVTGSMTPLVFLQILFAGFAAALIYRMARTLMPASYAWIPVLAYAIDPMAIFSDSSIVTDGLFSSLFVCIIYLAFFQSRMKGVLRWGVVGLLLGFAIMIRPIAEYLILIFPMLYLLRERMQGVREDGSRVKAMCAFVLACLIVVVPWAVRNEIYFGSFEISNLGSDDLLRNDVRGFLAWRALAATPSPLPAILVMRHTNDPIFGVIDQKIDGALATMTPPGGNPLNYEGRLAIHYILSDPIRYAYFHSINTIPFFVSSSIASYGQIAAQLRDNQDFYAPTSLSLLGSLQELRHPQSAASFVSAAWSVAPIGLELLWWTLVTLAAIIGAVLWRRKFTVILLAVLVLYFAALTGPMSSARYRIPAEPYLLILATTSTYALINRKRHI